MGIEKLPSPYEEISDAMKGTAKGMHDAERIVMLENIVRTLLIELYIRIPPPLSEDYRVKIRDILEKMPGKYLWDDK